jgi:iron complex transport system ATP-binding protein
VNSLELVGAGIELERHWLVRDLSFTVNPGEITALVGPNGAGKSTALRMLCGLWKPTEGEVRLEGRPLGERGAKEIARHLSFVAQSAQIQTSFTVREVVAMGRYPYENRWAGTTEKDRAAIEESMRRTDVLDLADRYANHLSGGELQRVLLARCLASETDTILLDEPTSNLDLLHTFDVLELCRELANEGRALVLAIHDLGSAIRFADRVVVLSKGRLIAAGGTRDVLTPDSILDVFGVRAEKVRTETGTEGFLFARK